MPNFGLKALFSRSGLPFKLKAGWPFCHTFGLFLHFLGQYWKKEGHRISRIINIKHIYMSSISMSNFGL